MLGALATTKEKIAGETGRLLAGSAHVVDRPKRVGQ